MTIVIIISAICIFQNIHGMNSRIPSCAELAANVVSKLCDPQENYESALKFLQSDIVNHDIASTIHHQLRKRAHDRIEQILENQTPQKIVILKEPNQNLPSSANLCLAYQPNYTSDQHFPMKNFHENFLLIPDPIEKQHNEPYLMKPTINADKTLCHHEQKIYDARTNALVSDCTIVNEKIKTLYPHAKELRIFSIAPNNNTVWAQFRTNLNSGICAFTLDSHDLIAYADNRFYYGCYSKNGHRVVVGKDSFPVIIEKQIAEIFNAATGQKQTAHLRHNFLRPFAISPAFNYILYFNLITPIQMYITSKLGNFKTLSMPPVSCVSNDGKFLASNSNTSTVIFNVETEEKTEIPPEIITESTHLCFCPNSHYLYIYNATDSDQPDILKIYDLKTMNIFATLPIANEKNEIKNPLIFCNDYNYLLLPRGQLLLHGQGFAKHTTLQQLIALLIAEHHYGRKEKIPKASRVKEILGTLKIKNYLQERIKKYQFEELP